MTTSNRTDNRRGCQQKPGKPYPEFSLTPHPTGRWCKKIRGQLHYFGKWADPEAALESYDQQKDALHAGLVPKEMPGAVGHTVADMVNQFGASKQDMVDAGELSRRSLDDYEATGKRLAAEFGRNRLLSDIGTDNFAALRKKLAKKWGPATLANEIQRVRVFFNYAFKEGMIEQPMRYGAGFDRPSKKVLRKARAEKEEQIFEAYEIRAMVNGALAVGKEGPELVQPSPLLKAMILLGINCGFGNADCRHAANEGHRPRRRPD